LTVARLTGSATFSDAVALQSPGRWIFVSGQIGLAADGRIVEGGFAAQADQTFANIDAILNRAGARLGDVVKITAYIVHFDRHFQDMGAARTRAFGEHLPTSATLGVSAMAFGALVEVEATAFVPEDGG
jgi:enamine deaminase RidA (YjgF/YER057c/UK114 family)